MKIIVIICFVLVCWCDACPEEGSRDFVINHIGKDAWDCENYVTCYLSMDFEEPESSQWTSWFTAGFRVPWVPLDTVSVRQGGKYRKLQSVDALLQVRDQNCRGFPPINEYVLDLPTEWVFAYGVCFQITDVDSFRLFMELRDKYMKVDR